MGQTLTNGIFLPNEGERNCYTGLAGNWRAIDGYIGAYNVHVADAVIHVSQEDRNKWDAVTSKADASALTAHTGNTTIHVTAEDKTKWDAVTGKADASALTAHTGNTEIHVTAEDKEAWNGKADASALTAHTGNTTIHVTAEDKTKWDAVTSKADDADVLHKSGDETSTGKKTFGDMATFKGSYIGNEATPHSRTNLLLESIRDTSGESGLYFTKYRANKAQGALVSSDIVSLGFDVLENSSRYNSVFSFQITGWTDGAPTQAKILSTLSSSSFGSRTRKSLINDINPGALSLPDLTAGVDISAYITDLTGASNINKFTPTAAGWISIGLSSADFIELYIPSALMGGSFTKSSINNYSQAFMPVIANKEVRITLKGSSIGWAKFYPCRGNI